MTDRRILISHAHVDREAAAVLARVISRVTLGQVQAWFSSDESGGGGMRPGELWMTSVLERLRTSAAAIALVTPGSVAQPWLYFECGFIAANVGAEVIPVCVGIDGVSALPFPLAMYQSYQISNRDALVLFLRKLATKFDVQFDEEMARPVVDDAVTRLASYASPPSSTEAEAARESPPVAELLAHIDRRFVELARTLEARPGARGPIEIVPYSVPLRVRFPGAEQNQILTIQQGSATVQDVLDNIYFMLRPRVPPMTYLETWALLGAIGGSLRAPLIVHGLAQRAPAHVLFAPGTSWQAVPLERPYVAGQPLALAEGLGVLPLPRAGSSDG